MVGLLSVHLTVSILLLGLLPPKMAGLVLACLGESVPDCRLGEGDERVLAARALGGVLVPFLGWGGDLPAEPSKHSIRL